MVLAVILLNLVPTLIFSQPIQSTLTRPNNVTGDYFLPVQEELFLVKTSIWQCNGGSDSYTQPDATPCVQLQVLFLGYIWCCMVPCRKFPGNHCSPGSSTTHFYQCVQCFVCPNSGMAACDFIWERKIPCCTRDFNPCQYCVWLGQTYQLLFCLTGSQNKKQTKRT